MRYKKLLLLSVALLIAGAAIVGAGCGGKPAQEVAEGALPSLQTGDRWVYNLTSSLTGEEQTYTLTYRVTGQESVNGRDCYLLEASFDPPYSEFMASATLWVEKDTLDMVKMYSAGEAQGASYTISAENSYDGPSLFPLSVGKEVSRTEIVTGVVTSEGEIVNEADETHTYIYKVEAIEDVTVAAGTFKCFKVVKYEDGDAYETTWYSDQVKSGEGVKRIYHDDEEAQELVSYSVK